MPGTDITDRQLAVLAGRGDSDAYRRLFERYQNQVYNFVYRLVNNAEDASDIVQNAFLRMYTVLSEKDIENFSAYLYRTARNLAYDEMRRRKRFADVDAEAIVPEDPNIYADPQRALMLQEQIGIVRKATAMLNENQREALLLRELQEFDYDQMSEVLGSNRNAVGAMLSRARLRFREELRMAHLKTERIPAECEGVIPLLSPYIDNELTDEQAGMVDAHLADCTFCTAALEEMREASRSFRMLIPVVPPADMAQAFTGRLADLAVHTAADTGAATGQAQPESGIPTTGESQPFTAAGSTGRPLASRFVRSKALWISIAALFVFVSAALLITEEINNEGDLVEPVNQVETKPIEQISPVGVIPDVETAGDTVEQIEVEPQVEEEVPAGQGTPQEVPGPVEPGQETTTGGNESTTTDQNTTPQDIDPQGADAAGGIPDAYDPEPPGVAE